ncbi:hypothetical protein CAOG_00631 [Capsaspora owczarzaki ATCC 30864]|uniref:Uncharacterized protein n=1 Tax=Capsaspora owczarzaki (strain ATCC 30864) TaxID=595528 RepID=A0A0D2U1L7_CAPO3|nr:hypothetical protein CAOG_00631 [Capsaspora owczarzaki ATCC 30864]KJE89081.1 hypothetical protein CAOG_000631 [Capsaspora owczarzaki ATCC 30864]|eukprot:XP_004365502.1 hypothetical protein CAOG_00631 [Capsaspora owczarzaki ATCC 30864]
MEQVDEERVAELNLFIEETATAIFQIHHFVTTQTGQVRDLVDKIQSNTKAIAAWKAMLAHGAAQVQSGAEAQRSAQSQRANIVGAPVGPLRIPRATQQ